ncbi:hypothetical protein Ciccas_013635 [Cichlidogyrus casuarinus]|uniref:Uncharacterized protein n=1 Tax=Cichlidogyrus casuarinus TaxID=1844966 RepID=A0ABD2PN60_9PLAT
MNKLVICLVLLGVVLSILNTTAAHNYDMEDYGLLEKRSGSESLYGNQMDIFTRKRRFDFDGIF